MLTQGRSQEFSLGGPNYRFQNFGKCNLGEYPLPPPPPMNDHVGVVGTFPNYLTGYVPPNSVVIWNAFVYCKTQSVVLHLNLPSTAGRLGKTLK